MASTTNDIVTSRRDGLTVLMAVAAAAVLYSGTLVCVDDDGYLVDGDDAADVLFAGVAGEGVDNSGGADGDVTIDVHRRGTFLFDSAGITADDVGRKVYVVDNQTVGLLGDAGVTKYVYVGKIVEVVSATSVWVELDPGGQGVEQYAIEAPGANATAFDLSTQAAKLGGKDFYIEGIEHIESFVTATGASDDRQIVTTNWTLAAGVLSAVGNESANTWFIVFRGELLKAA